MNNFSRIEFLRLLHVFAIAFFVVLIEAIQREKIPQHDSILTGDLYFHELMATKNPNRFKEQLRMPKEYFTDLLRILVDSGKLKHSRKVSAGEKLMIFLQLLQNKQTSTQRKVAA